MQLFPSLLFGISASLDALLVGISYGLRKVRIRLWQNLVISLVTLSGTCLSVGLGAWLAPLLPGILSRLAGSLILIFLGLYYIMKWLSVILRGRAGSSRQIGSVHLFRRGKLSARSFSAGGSSLKSHTLCE